MAVSRFMIYFQSVSPRSLLRLVLAWSFVFIPLFQTTASEYAWFKGNPADSAIEVRIYGPDEMDWFIESSSNLTSWMRLERPPLWSKPKRPPVRLIPVEEGNQFFRITPTSGLFDTNLLRHIDLTFANTNWAAVLGEMYPSSSNLPARLAMDNGVILEAVGVRFRGFTSYGRNPGKKPLNVEVSAYDPSAGLLGFKTVNLNNSAGDFVLFREALYFNIFSQYAPSPRGSLATVSINGGNKQVFGLVEQANSQLLYRYFPTDKGDRWKAPSTPDQRSSLAFLGTNLSSYTNFYELKSGNPTNAWPRLLNAIDRLNNGENSWEALDSILAMDSWIWFLALEIIFGDLDSYEHKGSDYGFYYEPESGRYHPIQHDGNETMADRSIFYALVRRSSPRPVLDRIYRNNELRQRFLAHSRTILEESLNPEVLLPAIDHYWGMSWSAVLADTNRGFSLAEGDTAHADALRSFVTNRYAALSNDREVTLRAPIINAVFPVFPLPKEADSAVILADVRAGDTNGISSVWLYWRDKHFGRFSRSEMFDDGEGEDDAAGDGIFTGTTTNYPPNSVVQFYIEARSGNTNRTASFHPARAERVTHSYRVALPWEE